MVARGFSQVPGVYYGEIFASAAVWGIIAIAQLAKRGRVLSTGNSTHHQDKMASSE